MAIFVSTSLFWPALVSVIFKNTNTAPDSCTVPPNFTTGKDKCYKVYYFSTYSTKSSRETFDKAKNFCEDFGGTLAQPRSLAEAQTLKNLTATYVGAKKDNGFDHFRWLDGSSFEEDYRYFNKSTLFISHLLKNDYTKECLTYYKYYNNFTSVDCESMQTYTCEFCISNPKMCGKRKMCLCTSKTQLHDLICRPTSEKCENIQERQCIDILIKTEISAIGPFGCALKPCSSTRWGSNCEFICMCKDLIACHVKTGKCPSSACHNGWFDPPSCNRTKCPVRRWGGNCDKDCFCANGQACEQETGICLTGCPTYVGGKSCTEPYPVKCKGINCFPCNCSQNSNCSASHLCLSDRPCKLSWQGPYCRTFNKCPIGTWGQFCENVCACRHSYQCTQRNGACHFGCKDGWHGVSCNESICPRGYYGQHCEKQCNCTFGVCNDTTGRCPEDDFVQLFEVCSSDPLKYGPKERNSTCWFPCINMNCVKCNPNSGGELCTECIPFRQLGDGSCYTVCRGSYGTKCDIPCNPGCRGNSCGYETGICTKGCRSRYWGENCEETCGHCAGYEDCDKKTGACIDGVCSPGYEGVNCNDTCSGRFGFNCSKPCSVNCEAPMKCHHINGRCLTGCKEGFYGDKCNSTYNVSDGFKGPWRPSNLGLLWMLPSLIPLIFTMCILGVICSRKVAGGMELDAIDMASPLREDRLQVQEDTMESEESTEIDYTTDMNTTTIISGSATDSSLYTATEYSYSSANSEENIVNAKK